MYGFQISARLHEQSIQDCACFRNDYWFMLVRRYFSTCLWLFHELVCLWGINSTSRLGLTRTTSRFSLSSSYPQTIQHHGTSRMSLTSPTWYYDTRRDLNYASDSFLCRFRSSRRKTHGSSIVPQPFVGYIKYSSSSLDCYCSFVVMYLSCGTSFTDALLAPTCLL